MGGKRDYEDIKIHGKDFSAQIPVRTFRVLDMIAIFQVDASVPIVLNGEKRVIINRKSWCALQTVANWCATANLFSFHTSHGGLTSLKLQLSKFNRKHSLNNSHSSL